MSDLEQIVERLLPLADQRFQNLSGTDPDQETVLLVRDQQAPIETRRMVVKKWLHHYRVLRGIRSEIIDQIVDAMLQYADGPRPANLGLNRENIVREFLVLQKRLAVPLGGRNSDSMTSKALWLCYPNDVPILDNYSEHALQILCRMQEVRVPKKITGRYERFLCAWFKIHAACRKTLDAIPLTQYPFRIRLLDWLLWYLGEPKFDESIES
jgi:hypothetical protein